MNFEPWTKSFAGQCFKGGLTIFRAEPAAMKKYIAAALALSAAISLCAASSNAAAKPPAPPNTPAAAELPFVTRATAELQKLYGTTALAAKAGYFRYNNEDSTGAISCVNPKYWTSDENHPSQIWYDVKGNLIGVDYSVPKTSTPPKMWSIIPARWFEFEPHVHYAVAAKALGASSTPKFGYILDSTIKKNGGSADHPTPADVVKAGKAKSASDVRFVFHFPDLWDLEFWLVPNPSGVFATKNPNVKPSAKAEKM
jgi:hypothetical protein